MTYAGAKHEPVAIGLVEHKALEDARLTEIVVKIGTERMFGE